jgi:hypothetical protein
MAISSDPAEWKDLTPRRYRQVYGTPAAIRVNGKGGPFNLGRMPDETLTDNERKLKQLRYILKRGRDRYRRLKPGMRMPMFKRLQALVVASNYLARIIRKENAKSGRAYKPKDILEFGVYKRSKGPRRGVYVDKIDWVFQDPTQCLQTHRSGLVPDNQDDLYTQLFAERFGVTIEQASYLLKEGAFGSLDRDDEGEDDDAGPVHVPPTEPTTITSLPTSANQGQDHT